MIATCDVVAVSRLVIYRAGLVTSRGKLKFAISTDVVVVSGSMAVVYTQLLRIVVVLRDAEPSVVRIRVTFENPTREHAAATHRRIETVSLRGFNSQRYFSRNTMNPRLQLD